MSFDRSRFTSDLLAAGVRPGGPLLVHSSLSALGGGGVEVTGGAETVLDALLDALAGGTVVIPTLSYLFTTPASPSFDVRSTPTNLGALPAAALRRACNGNGGVRSLHPTHSCVALGPLALELAPEHGNDCTPVGARSPFARVCELGGQVAFLGCGARCNTSMHGVEEALPSGPPPYLLQSGTIQYAVTDSMGMTSLVDHRRHNFSSVGQRYERLIDFMPEGSVTRGKVGEAECIVMDARTMWATATDILERDPWAFVERGVKEGHDLVVSKSAEGVYRYVVTSARLAEYTGEQEEVVSNA